MAAGRRFAPQNIVDPAEFLTEDQILREDPDFGTFAFEGNLEAIQWLARRRLLKNTSICPTCLIQMSFVQKQKTKDGFQWKCRRCGKSGSIRADSFFSYSHLSFVQILKMLYGWSQDYLQKQIAHEARIGRGATHSRVDWCNFFREICEQHLEENPEEIGGLTEEGFSKVVEIDESKFFHRKYHRGQWREGHWVFGGIERGSGKCFLVEVPDRTRNTLLAIIQRMVLPGTIIVTDGWRPYATIERDLGNIYEHQVIIHDENFVDPYNREIHTQNVENMWMRAKRKLRRQFGTSQVLFTSYLHEFMWRNKFRGQNIFGRFILSVKDAYPLN